MPRKTSFYVDDVSEAIVAARDVAPSSVRRLGRRSLLFREVLRRYDAICRTDLPALSSEEWSLLLTAGAGWAAESVTVSTRLGLLFGAAHAAGLEPLIRKLVTLTAGESTALIDFIERHWAAKARGDAPPTIPLGASAGVEATQ